MIGTLGVIKMIGGIIINGIVCSLTGNFNGFLVCTHLIFITRLFFYLQLFNTVINALTTARKVKLTYVVLDQNQPESWAPLIKQHNVFVSIFYTPLLHIYTGSESFKTTDITCQKERNIITFFYVIPNSRQLLTDPITTDLKRPKFPHASLSSPADQDWLLR